MNEKLETQTENEDRNSRKNELEDIVIQYI